MTKSVTICALVSLLCGCVPRYQNRPWAHCTYSSGKAYVMQGTEKLKTATLLTADGTFKKFTFPVERRFDLFENGEPKMHLGHFIHKGRDCDNSYYRFFPQLNTLVSCEDYDAKIQNLTLRKSFRVDGRFLGIDQESESRFCLVRSFNSNRMSEVDKITGRSVKLTRASADFVGDTWHVDLFVSEDGRKITRAETDYANKTITISAWDIQKEVLLIQPHKVSYANELDPAEVLLCGAGEGSVLLIVSESQTFATTRRISIKTFAIGSFALRHDIVVELHGFKPHAFADSPNTVAILFNDSGSPFRDSYRWGLKRYDLATGRCISTDLIQVPATGESSKVNQRE